MHSMNPSAPQASEARECVMAVVEDYLQHLAARGASPKTVQTYQSGLKPFASFLTAAGFSRLQDVLAEDIGRYALQMDRQGLKRASQDLYLRAVRGLFKWLETNHRIFSNPTRGCSPRPPSSPLQTVPSETDVARLLAQPDTATPLGIRDRALLEAAYSTGARREEMANLKLQDLDLSGGTLRILGKGAKERMVPLGQEAQRWLGRYLTEVRPEFNGGPDPNALWLGARGRPLGYAGVREVVQRHARAAALAITLTPHCLRRACATHMLRRGAHPAQIQRLLGHASLQSLNHYLHLAIVDLKQAHAASAPGQ